MEISLERVDRGYSIIGDSSKDIKYFILSLNEYNKLKEYNKIMTPEENEFWNGEGNEFYDGYLFGVPFL